ncbi:MAG TPA: ABC transporter permease [Gammaproteobacteria bacterium]
MRQALADLLHHRELLWTIAYRDVRIKYKQSIMGFLWALLMPLLIVLAGVIVRYGYSVLSNTPLRVTDIAAVAVKSVPWAFFVSTVRFATSSLIGNVNLVTKIYFPREIFPIATVISNLFDFIVASCALTVLLALAGIKVGLEALWLPVIFVVLVSLCLGVGFFVSAASLFFRDVKYIVEVFLTFGIFFTPVLYTTDMIGSAREYILLNPVAPVLESIEFVIVRGRAPDLPWLGYSAAVGLVLLLFGFRFFKRVEPAFAERI